ncbi:MAG TPA: hypothetical protein EYP94_01055 [Gammaproteobacteria bacterium]|nr:hypothetical protein [Gammaproteobacteria bacterium]
MKKHLLILCLSISFIGYAQLINADDAKSTMSCDHKVSMNDDLLSKVLKHRDSAFETCLSCTKGDCLMKAWPEEGRANEAICQRLFCTPKKVSKGFEVPADTPRGKSSFSYTYSISKKGRLTDINILSVDGPYKRADALKFLKSLTKKTQYEPLVYDNKKYKITNLASSMAVNTKLDNE